MSILASNIVIYAAANMPEDDAALAGGAVDLTARLAFEDIAPTGNIQIVSSAAGDTTQTVTVTGRDAAGLVIAEAKTLTGTTPVVMTTETAWERLVKAVKSATTTGDVAVEAVTATRANTAQAGAAESATEMASITLDAGADATDDTYNGLALRITGGTGAGQIRRVIDYEGATRKAWVHADWAVVPDNTSVFRLAQGMVFEKAPNEVSTILRAFWDVAADPPGGAQQDFHVKGFVSNEHATLALTNAQIIEQADPSGAITFALETTLDGTGTSTNRKTAPGGVTTFDDADKSVQSAPVGTHAAGVRQGVWLRLRLPAGAAAAKTTWTIRETGTTT